MPLRIYNTLTGQKEEFKPLNPPEVKMYVCGPTVYDEPHIGHLRSAYVFEVMRRWMEHSGYKVRFVRNVTDVDDKIIDKARQEGSADLKAATTAVSSKYFDLYKKDLATLGIQEPTVEPRATTHIRQMQDLIAGLIQKGFAYHVSGSSDVYFEVKKFSSYGKLSKQKIDEMMDQARKESAPGKRDPLDFALWKGAKSDEPAWDSPWGPGRPGWHIECSAMNLACLGEQIDIHGGGLDLKFPHHENERAQSESATGKSFAKYWVHHGLLTVREQKMSKSLKNFTTLDTAKKMSTTGLEDLKFLFLGTHYSLPLDFSDERMKMQKGVRDRFANFFDDIPPVAGTVDDRAKKIEADFGEAMNDDFNTPQAIAALHELAGHGRSVKEPSVQKAVAARVQALAGILGLSFGATAQNASVDDLVRQRDEAKKTKNFKRADEIRDILKNQGIELKDSPQGTTWRKA